MSDSQSNLTVETLRESTDRDDAPPGGVSGPVAALWHARKGNLARAFDAVADNTSKDAAWVRAHLHRRKGETERAGEWYRAAGRDPSTHQVDQEWTEIAAGVLLNV